MNKKSYIVVTLGFILLCAFVIGCGGAKKEGGTTAGSDAQTSAAGERVHSQKAKEDFAAAAKMYQEAKAAGWNDASCKKIAGEFKDVAEDYSNMPEALYNVGSVYKECGMNDEAKGAFKDVLKVYPKHQLAMTHLAVMELEKEDAKKAMAMLEKIISVAGNTKEVVPAYVNKATIYRKKARKSKKDEDFKAAQNDLRRALAIDSNYMPALYQLAMLYLDRAVVKEKASFLDLANIVCKQATGLDPEYGAIYHVMGMVALQKDELVNALKLFEAAFSKDPSLFASYMNFAAINLGFRGYEAAKQAFEKAIAIDPNSYDAHIGLGVALRGLGDFQGAKTEYEKAKAIDSARVDYIFNVGLLEMDYLNTGTQDGFRKAKKVFELFVGKAKGKPRYEEDPDGRGPERSWIKKAEDRMALCDKNVKQLIEAEKAMAELEKMKAEAAKREAEMKAQMEKAKELEAKEAEGAVAPEDAIVEGEEEAAPAPAAEGETPAEAPAAGEDGGAPAAEGGE